jgi:hypothetical protein
MLAAILTCVMANPSLTESSLSRPSAISPDLELNLEESATTSSEQTEVLSQSESFSILNSNGSCVTVFQNGGDRLVALQNSDGGWDWPLDDGSPNNASPLNTVGPIGMGLALAYLHTGDTVHQVALQNAGALLLTKTNNFSPSDGYLAAMLDQILGGTTYVNHVTTNFYGLLADGTYDRNGAGTLYDTAAYVALIRNARASQGIANLAAWDIGMGLVGAASAGADTTAWIAGVKAEIDELDGNNYYDVLGLAGAVYGLAFVGEDYDPIAGEHSGASSLGELADILAGYQLLTGGFTWNSNYLEEGQDNETIQETAYALLALNEADRAWYFYEITDAVDYMKNVQLGTGGWKNWAGAGENNEVTGEALWGIAVGLPGPATSNVAANPNPVSIESQVEITANVDNTGLGCSNIASAEYSLDGGEWVEMSAKDGTFDAVSEVVKATTLTAPSEAEIYDLCVRGKDEAGNTGDPECILLVVYDSSGGFVTGGGWITSPADAMPPTTSNVTVSGTSGDTSIDPDAVYAPYYLRYVGDPPPAGYDPSHNYQWGSPAIFTTSPEDGPVTLQGTIDVSAQTVGQVAMIGLLDQDDLAAGNSSWQRGAYIYVYRSSITSWKIGPSDGNAGGEIVQTFITIADTDLPADGILDVTFTVDGTADYTTCASGSYSSPAGCMTLQIMGGSVNATLTDSYGDVVGNNSASPEFANGAVLGWDDYIGSDVGFTLTAPSIISSGSPEGKATFGFVSKYKKGASVPTGNTEFQFKAGDLNFHSSSYDWLVVTGSNYAKYKGRGTINGEPAPNSEDYKFMLWAGDDDPDTFRIRIWWEENGTEHIVYDNGMDQEIGGGSIVIHTKKK